MHVHVECWVPGNPSRNEARAIATIMIGDLCGDSKNACFDYGGPGGRYTGRHDGYAPYKDPANLQKCTICCGHGIRYDIKYSKEISKLEIEGSRIVGVKGNTIMTKGGTICNGCGGTCKEVKVGLVPHAEDVMRVSRISRKLTAHSIVYSMDGETRIEDLPGRQYVLPTLKKLGLKGGVLVTCDCHY